MITVGIAAPTSFYGPEVHALVHHFKADAEVRYVLVEDPSDLEDSTFDFAHIMMGFDPLWHKHRVPRIHDYASLSTPPWGRLKDGLKRRAQSRPVLRSFLSPYVREELGFNRQVPHILRDMGVPDAFYESKDVKPTYDIGYAGSLTSARGLLEPISRLAASGFTILLIGQPQPQLRQALRNFSQVEFTGRLPQSEVPNALRQCSYGLNYVPDIPPYNQQTSTKVLEYTALGLRVVTNNYPWIRRFQIEHGVRFANIDSRAWTPETLRLEPITNATPEQFRWSAVIERSELRQHLLGIANGS